MNLSSTTICQRLKNLLRTLGLPILRAGRHHQAAAAAGVAVVPRLLELQLLLAFPTLVLHGIRIYYVHESQLSFSYKEPAPSWLSNPLNPRASLDLAWT